MIVLLIISGKKTQHKYIYIYLSLCSSSKSRTHLLAAQHTSRFSPPHSLYHTQTKIGDWTPQKKKRNSGSGAMSHWPCYKERGGGHTHKEDVLTSPRHHPPPPPRGQRHRYHAATRAASSCAVQPPPPPPPLRAARPASSALPPRR